MDPSKFKKLSVIDFNAKELKQWFDVTVNLLTVVIFAVILYHQLSTELAFVGSLRQ